jgi:hypothetical protein
MPNSGIANHNADLENRQEANGFYYSSSAERIIDESGSGVINLSLLTEEGGKMRDVNSSGDKSYEFIRDELNDKLAANEKLLDSKIGRIEDSVQHMKEMLDIRIGHIESIAGEIKQIGQEVKSSNKGMQQWSAALVITVILGMVAVVATLLYSNSQLLVAILSLGKN